MRQEPTGGAISQLVPPVSYWDATMPHDDDTLRCSNCGCTAVTILVDYVPGMWGGGRAECQHCRCTFRFTFTEEQEPADQEQQVQPSHAARGGTRA